MSNAPRNPRAACPWAARDGPRGMGPRQPIDTQVLLRVLSYLKPLLAAPAVGVLLHRAGIAIATRLGRHVPRAR